MLLWLLSYSSFKNSTYFMAHILTEILFLGFSKIFMIFSFLSEEHSHFSPLCDHRYCHLDHISKNKTHRQLSLHYSYMERQKKVLMIVADLHDGRLSRYIYNGLLRRFQNQSVVILFLKRLGSWIL